MRARTLYLYGKLGKEFGRKHKVYVDSVVEAMRYLAANFGDKFYAQIKEGYYKIKKVTKGATTFVDEKGLTFNLGEGDIYVIPVTRGAAGTRQKQVGMIVAGIALAAVTFGVGIALAPVTVGAALTTTAGAGAAVAATGAIGAVAFSMSAALVLQGIAGLLTPLPKTKGQQKEVDRNEGTSAGILNTSQEGSTIPVIYGKVKVGSVVISSGVYAEQMATKSQYNDVITYLKEYIARMTDMLNAYDVAINTTASSLDEVTNSGGYSYYPGRYPHIQTNLQRLRNQFATLLADAKYLQSQEINTMSLDTYENLVDRTITLTSGTEQTQGAINIIKGMYDVVGEVCDFYVNEQPTKMSKKATDLKKGVVVTSLVVTEPKMRVYRNRNHLVRRPFGEYTYLGYYATTTTDNSFKNTAILTPLDRCYYMTSVFDYVLKDLKKRENW